MTVRCIFAKFTRIQNPHILSQRLLSTSCNNVLCKRYTRPLSGPPEQVILHKDIIDKHKAREQLAKQSKEHLNIEDLALLEKMQTEAEANDMPIPGLQNPYTKPPPKCILCEYNIDLDYKNIRLLSQFVSPYTGQIYNRGTTGLCQFMQKRIAKLIKRARFFGFLPYTMKDPNFLRDPKLFDPFYGPIVKKEN